MFLRLTSPQRLTAVLLIALGLGVACGPAAAPTPTKAAAPVAAPTATATAVPAAPKRGGKITVVVAGEPVTMSVSASPNPAPSNYGPLSDSLTERDFEKGIIVPVLAEKWEMIDSKTWRFYLQKNVKFWNGEAFTPEGVIADLEWESSPANKARLPRYVQDTTGKVVAPYTVELICAAPCALLPNGMFHLKFQAPQWAKDNPELYKTTSVSNGPYKLAEYKRGESMKLTRFEEYWGPARYDGYLGAQLAKLPPVEEATIIWRGEAKVRAAMVATGEAHVAMDIGVQNRTLVPKFVASLPGTENDVLRLNSRADPLMKDKRFRQALVYAIDRETITKTILGGLSKPIDLPFAPGSVGWTDDIARFPYNPTKARQLIKEGGFEGGKVTMATTSTDPTRNELFQAILGYWEAVGLKTQLIPVEAALATQVWSVGVGAISPYSVAGQFNHTNDQFDARVSLNYADCRQAYSLWRCDPDEQKWFQAKLDEASAAVGDDRQRKMAELMKWFIDEVAFPAMWTPVNIHGLKADTDYKIDGFANNVLVARMRQLQ
ncbi:MAG: hypothetical protein HY531_02695 [Chloroflexi bacterium]|nr:hypothetical protein [Chloroflexota bacterium]